MRIQSTWESKGEGIEITPLQNTKWAKLNDNNLIFQSKPKSGNSKEKTLHDALKDVIPTISSLLEVHDKLKESPRSSYSPGGEWREALTSPFTIQRYNFGGDMLERRVPINFVEKIEAMQISAEDVALVLAIYHFSLRTNLPNLVKFIHTDSGVVSCNDCFIGAPHFV